MTREDSGVLCFSSRQGLTHGVRLECNPDIPVTPGEEHYVLYTSLDEVFCPAVTREQPLALPRKSNGRLDFLGQNKRKPEFPVITRESRHN